MQAEVKKWFLIITTPIISALLINIKWSIILPACPVWHKNSRSISMNYTGDLVSTEYRSMEMILRAPAWPGLVLCCVCIVRRRLALAGVCVSSAPSLYLVERLQRYPLVCQPGGRLIVLCVGGGGGGRGYQLGEQGLRWEREGSLQGN